MRGGRSDQRVKKGHCFGAVNEVFRLDLGTQEENCGRVKRRGRKSTNSGQ